MVTNFTTRKLLKLSYANPINKAMRILVAARTFKRFEARYNVYEVETNAENVHLTSGKREESRNEQYKAREIT